MFEINGESLSWGDDAACGKPENEDFQPYFFSPKPEERHQAKILCASCPVKDLCVKWALENKEIWGIWGGKDENEIRRTLSVNAEGNEVRRGRFPQCPSCGERTSRLEAKYVDVPDGGRWTSVKAVECTVCGFEWKSRTSANAVNAYHQQRADKKKREQERIEKEREKAEAAKARRVAKAEARIQKKRDGEGVPSSDHE